MKIIKEELTTDDYILKGYEMIFLTQRDENKHDRMAIMINPEIEPADLLTAISRLNQVCAKTLNMEYKTYLSLLKKTYEFTLRTENLNLSEEQLQRMINKDLNGFLKFGEK